MPRPRNIVRKVKLGCWITEDLYARMNLRLYSPIEGRVPVGAPGEFVEKAIVELLDKVELTERMTN